MQYTLASTVVVALGLISNVVRTQHLKCYSTKYGSALYIGMNDVLDHHACLFKNSNLHFHFQ